MPKERGFRGLAALSREFFTACDGSADMFTVMELQDRLRRLGVWYFTDGMSAVQAGEFAATGRGARLLDAVAPRHGRA